MTWGAVAVAGASIVGGYMASEAAGDAADAQEGAANAASGTSMAQYRQNRTDQAPYRAAGGDALSMLSNALRLPSASRPFTQEALVDTSGAVPSYNARLYQESPAYRQAWDQFSQEHQTQFHSGLATTSDSANIDRRLRALLGDKLSVEEQARAQNQANDPMFGDLLKPFTNAEFEKDPGYEFRRNEGLRGTENTAAARGGLLSGNTLKALTRFNQDYASNEFGNAFNRFNINQSNKFNRLASVAGIGQTAVNQLGQAGMNMANNVSQNQLQAGNARAAGYIGQSNALNSSLSNGVNWYNQNQMANSLRQNQPSQQNQPSNDGYYDRFSGDYTGLN